MSMSFSYVAVTADAQSVEDALFALCPDFFIMERRPQLGTFVQMYGYCQSRSGYLNGLHPNDVKAFCQHQGWCIIIDFSLTLPEANQVLSTLSTQFGKVVTAVTHGASATAYFALFENGQMKRRILSSNGAISAHGEPLPEEAGIEGDAFYVKELDILWQAQGLPPYLVRLGGPYSAVHYLDNTEESVEKDIAEIAERTRQYEELEAMKARQRSTLQPADFAPPTESQPAVLVRSGDSAGHAQPNTLEPPAAPANEQPAASEQPAPAPQSPQPPDETSPPLPSTSEQAPAEGPQSLPVTSEQPVAESPQPINVAGEQPTPTSEQPAENEQSSEQPRISSLLATADDIDSLPAESDHQNHYQTQSNIVSKESLSELSGSEDSQNSESPSPGSPDDEALADTKEIESGEDEHDDDDDEKAEKPKDKPWWKLW
jgi:hypothetical protein